MTIQCRHCGHNVPEANNCTICNFPLMKSEKEQATFIARQIREESNVRDTIQKMQYPRYILFVLSALHMIAPFTPLYPETDIIVLIMNVGIGVMTFGILSFRMPQVALLTPLIIMILIYMISAIADPSTLLVGIIWKAIILTGLSYGFYRAYDADRTLKKNPYLAKKLGYTRIGQKAGGADF